MNIEGIIKLDRALCRHKIWLAEKPFTKGQAWVDLLLLANDCAGAFDKRGREVQVERGQTAWSKKGLADRWGWSQGKVAAYLVYLETQGMITAQSDELTTVITLTNYEAYQGIPESKSIAAKEQTESRLRAECDQNATRMGADCEQNETERERDRDCTAPSEKEGIGIGIGRGGAAAEPSKEPGKEPEMPGWVPSDEEVMEFGATFPGQGTLPGPMDPGFVAQWLQKVLGRQEFPPRWRRHIVSDWRVWHLASLTGGANGGAGKIAAKTGDTVSANVAMIQREGELKRLREEALLVEEEIEALDMAGADIREPKKRLKELEAKIRAVAMVN